MPTPYDLRVLHTLRSRGQLPQLSIFVTDKYQWQQMLLDFGALCIRVQGVADTEHDWSAIRGLNCMLVCRGLGFHDAWHRGGYAKLGHALLAAEPAQLETFHPEEDWQPGPCMSRVVVGTQLPLMKLQERDAMLYRLLRYG
jgi:hypothetical protein